jgi:SPP1 gp7 family putative phage head morphogenesis protein
MNFTDNEIEDLFKGIFAGDITKENLPVDLYQSIAQFLEKGLLNGAGGPVTSFDGKDLDLIQELRTNIYMFSAAKTYQEVRGMTDLLYNEDDKVKPFDEFFEDARALYNNYNVNYAQTEYNTAVASGQMGIRWNQIEADKDVLPLLKMTVVEDAQTTEICQPLDGITLPVGDPFWDEFYPPNHWNCRSTVLQLDEGDISSKAQVDKAKEHAEEDMQDVFRMNVGKDEIVFSPDHPYFKVPKEDKELAKRNFDLPMPEDLQNRFIPATSIKEAKKLIVDTISENAGFNVKAIKMSSQLSLDQVNERYKTLKGLFEEYKTSEVPNRDRAINVTFKSGQSYYGKISFAYRRDLTELFITDMNFGDQVTKSSERLFDPLSKALRGKSRVDEKNLNISTTVHEFGHVIAQSEQVHIKGCPEYLKSFFKELRGIRDDYFKEINVLTRENDFLAINKLYLGKYASQDIDEFLAESFTEYKLSSNPSKFAIKVGELIDKTFKR